MKRFVVAAISASVLLVNLPAQASHSAGLILRATVENRLGRSLTATESREFDDAIHEAIEALSPQRQAFLDTIREVTGLGAQTSDFILSPLGSKDDLRYDSLILKLETAAGRTLNTEERHKIAQAEEAERAAAGPIIKHCIERISKAVNLPYDAIKRLVESGGL